MSPVGDLLQSHRIQVDERLRAGGELLSDLRSQVASLEIWLDGIASQEQKLMQLGDQIGAIPMPVQQPAPPEIGNLGWQMDMILNTMVEGVLVIDPGDRVVMANKMAEAILEGKLVGRSVEDVCDDPRWIKTYQIVKAAAGLRKEQPGSELTGATTRLAIAQRMLRASFRIDLKPGRAPAGIVVIVSDVTAEREAERAKDSFITSASQELRTPMTSIVGYTDLLLSESVGTLEDAQHMFLSRIRTNAERIGGQLNNLLAMVDVDNRQLAVRAEAMDLGSSVQEAVDAVRSRAIERQQVLDISVEPGLPLVDADPDAMYHVLTNLLQNAHRCSPDRSRIVLRAGRVRHENEMYVSVSVTDSGGGVAPEDFKKVFNRFYRSDSQHVRGLGDPEMSLPIVKVLVEAHGGRVWMDSVAGAGTTFTALLPIHSAER
jgi:signal transduction histidine kinase